ncbi:hypothetical protein ACPXCX_46895, partial [Streptomyces sp. DT225]
CGCCTAPLCEKGRSSVRECAGHAPAASLETVTGCPCSSATTTNTAAWRMARVRVTRLAQEERLTGEAEGVMRLLEAGENGKAAAAPDELVGPLREAGLIQTLQGMPVLTPLGRTYLHAVDEVRAPAVVRVVDVDTVERTVAVEVAAWRTGEAVTVLLDQVVADTELDAAQLPGQWLIADANCDAPDPSRLVLTRFRASAPLPSGWIGGSL